MNTVGLALHQGRITGRFGRAEDFTPVMLDAAPAGAVVEARLVGRAAEALLGEVVASGRNAEPRLAS